MAFCLHYENVEDVFLHDWGAYQVGLSVPPTQYISSSEMGMEGWRGWIFLYVCLRVCVWAIGCVCVIWEIKWLSLTSFASELKRTIWTSANNHWRNTKYLKTMFNDLANPFAHFGNEHNNTDSVKSLPNTISGYLLGKHIKWVKKIIKVFLVYFQEVNS